MFFLDANLLQVQEGARKSISTPTHFSDTSQTSTTAETRSTLTIASFRRTWWGWIVRSAPIKSSSTVGRPCLTTWEPSTRTTVLTRWSSCAGSATGETTLLQTLWSTLRRPTSAGEPGRPCPAPAGPPGACHRCQHRHPGQTGAEVLVSGVTEEEEISIIIELVMGTPGQDHHQPKSTDINTQVHVNI